MIMIYRGVVVAVKQLNYSRLHSIIIYDDKEKIAPTKALKYASKPLKQYRTSFKPHTPIQI